MYTFALFASEVAICLGIALAVTHLLSPLLKELLAETCGTAQRAAFWVTFTQLMLFMAPLLLVVFFTKTGTVMQANAAVVVKDALFLALLGEFIALSAVGIVMWQSIVAFTKGNIANQPPTFTADSRGT